MFVKPPQPLNARAPIEVTLSPITTLVKLQPLNAEEPIEVTLSVISTLVILQPKNALSAIVVTTLSLYTFGITTFAGKENLLFLVME